MGADDWIFVVDCFQPHIEEIKRSCPIEGKGQCSRHTFRQLIRQSHCSHTAGWVKCRKETKLSLPAAKPSAIGPSQERQVARRQRPGRYHPYGRIKRTIGRVKRVMLWE